MDTQVQQLIEEAEEAIKFADVRGSSIALSGIAQTLASGDQDQATSAKLQSYVPALQYVQFDSLSENAAVSLFRDHLDALFQVPDLDIMAKLRSRMDDLALFYDGSIAHVTNLITALQASSMTLGRVDILVNNKKVKPTVANWLADFLASPQQSRPYRVNIDEINYVSKSENGRTLGLEERDKLLEILKIYDTLRNSLIFLQNIPEPEEGEDPWEGFDLAYFEPGYVDEEEVALTAAKPEHKPVPEPTIDLSAQFARTSPDYQPGMFGVRANEHNLQDVLRQKPENPSGDSSAGVTLEAKPGEKVVTPKAQAGLGAITHPPVPTPPREFSTLPPQTTTKPTSTEATPSQPSALRFAPPLQVQKQGPLDMRSPGPMPASPKTPAPLTMPPLSSKPEAKPMPDLPPVLPPMSGNADDIQKKLSDLKSKLGN